MVCALALAATITLGGCGSSSGGDDGASKIQALVTKAEPLSTSERLQLQKAVVAVTSGHIFNVASPVSTVAGFEVQWGVDGRIEFTRTADPVEIEDEQGQPLHGTAIAVHHYTGESIKECATGEDRGEKVVLYDNLFGRDYVEIEQRPRDVQDLTIAIDDPDTVDSGFDAGVGARLFERKLADRTSKLWIEASGTPARFTNSISPQGFVSTVDEKEPQESLAATPNLTPPDCLDSHRFG